MKRLALALCLFSMIGLMPISKASATEDIIRIEVGKDYSRYSNDEMRRRVWDPERAVYQLQMRIFQLEMQGNRPSLPDSKQWTCMMQSFGKTYSATNSSRMAALSSVLKKCSDATDAIHCHDFDVKCSNE